MKVLLVSTNTERLGMVAMPLGLALVAAATRRRGHEVSVLDLVRPRFYLEPGLAPWIYRGVDEIAGAAVRVRV